MLNTCAVFRIIEGFRWSALCLYYDNQSISMNNYQKQSTHCSGFINQITIDCEAIRTYVPVSLDRNKKFFNIIYSQIEV